MRNCFAVLPAVLPFACGGGDSSTYTLYRSSPTSEAMRLHVATFDSADGEKYNREPCDITRELFQKQPGVTVRYWCEKGRFRR